MPSAISYSLALISPSVSPVKLFSPNLSSAIYVLSCSIRYLEILVACPTKIGRTPVAFGSSVPVCPIFFVFSSFLKTFITSCDV